MQETQKITGTQLCLLLFSFVFPALVIPVPGLMASFAKQSGWLAVFPAALIALLNIWVLVALANRYPGLTIIEYSSKIVGKWLGKCIGFYLLYYLYSLVSVVANEHTRFVNTFLLPHTPPLVGVLTIMLLSGIAVYTGIEVIGRSNEFLAPLIILFLIPLFILSLSNSDPGQLKPLFGEGIKPILQASIVVSGNINQIFIIGWLLPFLNKPKEGRKMALIALGGIVLLIVIVDLLTTMIFGPITARLNYAFMGVIQYIGLQGSFERLEAIAVSIWVVGLFVKVALLLFMISLTLTQLFGIRNYKIIILPVSLFACITSVWVFKNRAEYQNFLALSFPYWSILTQNFLPLTLLLIDTVKKKVKQSLL